MKQQETPIAVIGKIVYGVEREFNEVLVDQSINFRREAEFAMQIIEGNSYMLTTAMKNQQSVVNAVKNIAAIGISLNPAKKQAYLVPRRPKAGADTAICLDISYMGLIDLAVESGSIRWAQAKLVRENDEYESQGIDKPPVHKYKAFASALDRGQIIGVYVVVKTVDGDFLTHEMGLEEVHAIRDRSESWKAYVKDETKKCPWVTDAGEMIKKTVIKQAAKTWPRGSGRLEQAIHHLNTDGGEGLVDINEPPVHSDPEPTKLLVEARVAADAGREQFGVFWKGLNGAKRTQLGPHLGDLQARADKIDGVPK
jgi:recombination protein RecT